MENFQLPKLLQEKNHTDDSNEISPNRSWIRPQGFVKKTVEGIAYVLREELFAEQLANQAGLLQNIDPRVKVLTTILLIILASLIHHPLTLLAFNIWVLWLAVVSRVPLKMFVKRVWLVVPFFTGIIAFPSIFNFVYPGDPLLTLFHFAHQHQVGPWTIPQTLSITYQGTRGAILLILRVGASVSLAVLLTLTTRWHVLLKALNMVFIPQIFVCIMEMTYRYIYILLKASTDMFIARESRTVGHTSTKEQRQFVSGTMGALFNKSYIMADEVHAAMISRGYTGTPKVIVNFQMRSMDWVWAAFIVIVAILFFGGDRLFVK